MLQMHKFFAAALGAALTVCLTGIQAQDRYGIGRTATPAEIVG